ncbi:glycoside hydrolase family 3 protein [Chaetomium sp. MPI-SDFR-AT-0129]|nr:glycoside hydrolase family 3 protein [Chaetomium sp. MPI-SDFR-AT-0129]
METDTMDRAIGQMLIMGWDGTEVTPSIRHLIEEHHVGSILLTAKNLKSAQQTARLVQELQTIAHQAGHPYPLLIALDQENGGVNSLFDEDYICQFPSSMGQAAASSADLAYKVAKATATEISAVGVNLILGPVLDVLTNARYQPLGVRAIGDDPQEVSQYGIAAMNGYKEAGVATCGKHFPSYGNLDFLGSSLDIPTITQTLEELSLSALVPFRNAIATGNLDAMFVGGCGITNPSMNVNHACLSEQVIDDLLRNELGFQGVAISECLEMEGLRNEIGVRTGTVMAVEAGCDLVLLCRAYDVQLEAIAGLKLGVENELITKERVYTSLRRLFRMKKQCTSWQKALNPPGISLLSKIHPGHLALSLKAYDDSIAVIRDNEGLLPLTKSMHQEEELLLLTPLVKPLPASPMTRALQEKHRPDTVHERWVHNTRGAIMSGEGVFREFGRSLARERHGKLLHTSYTAHGVRPVHENLINRASSIIIVTADANRNLYQAGFTKHVAMMCSLLRASGQKKSLIVVAVSSPYDFAMDKSVGTYICTFDFTELAMSALVGVLCGKSKPQGTLPGTLRKSRKALKSRQHWLVEAYDRDRDARYLDDLLQALARASAPAHQFLLTTNAHSFELFNPNIEEAHFMVRNSSTKALYGFCATYFVHGTGIIGAVFVDPSKRNLSIGRSLQRRALRGLAQKRGIKKMQLGMSFPGVFPGIPADDSANLRQWFANGGWDLQFPRRISNLTIPSLAGWNPPEGLLQSIQRAGISFDLIHGPENAESVLDHIKTHSHPEVLELYRFALQETKTCGVVRAKGPGEALLGTVIICSPGSPLSGFIPPLQPGPGEDEQPIGGIVAPIIAPSSGGQAQATLVLQGLALMGVRQNKAHKSLRSVLSWVHDEAQEPLVAMGFEVVQAFEQFTSSPENVSWVV